MTKDTMMKLAIEGWRGVNHSYALVNQCQVLEMLRLPGLQLFHRDLPFAMPHWNAKTHAPGFAPEDLARIAALNEPGDEAVDAVYRICSPFRTGCGGRPVRGRGRAGRTAPSINFMVTEMGLSEKSFEPGAQHADAFTRDANLIVTPTRWSRERLLEWGYPADKVHVVTHGVNAHTFRPLDTDERALNRRNLGFDDGSYVFLNLGAAMWNKGLDVLLLAYATLRQKHRHIRLVLKDQRSLYGIGMDSTIKTLCQSHPQLFGADTLASISLVTDNLSQAHLRALYGMADCYVSPYRAEGFNLPVLEAIACGTPVVVTGHGATDDFCNPAVAMRLDSTPGTLDSGEGGRVARYREPSLDATVQAMDCMAQGQGLTRSAAFEAARSRLVQAMTWAQPVQRLLALVRTQCGAAAPDSLPDAATTAVATATVAADPHSKPTACAV